MRLRVGRLLLFAVSMRLLSSYKILVYNSKFAYSHSLFLGQISDSLVDAEHNVTCLLPSIDPSVSDGTNKCNKIHIDQHPAVKQAYDSNDQINFFDLRLFHPYTAYVLGWTYGRHFERTCQRVLEEPNLIERLRAEKYDVMITESFDMCGIGITHAIAPRAVIGSSSTFIFGSQLAEFGIESAFSYRPSLITSDLDVTSISSRFWNLIGEFLVRATFWYPRFAVESVLRRHFGTEYPSIAEQSANVSFVFTNSEPLIDFASPATSRVVPIPGIGITEPKILDKYWEYLLNLRNRTVLISFGSMAKSIQMPMESKKGILRAISRFPDITFIWKYEESEDEFSLNHALKIPNLVLTKWMPQRDILNHSKLALFISHGGMGSTLQRARLGVPGIFVPIFFDQPRNAKLMELRGIGVVFDKFQLHDDEKLAKTIEEVLENPKFAENARRMSKILASKPFTSKQLILKHVEFAAEFGPSTALRPRSFDMSVIEYYNLDILFVFLVLIPLLSVCYFVGKRICTNFASNEKAKNDK